MGFQTASSSGTPGKLGDEKLQSEVRDDIRDDDAEQLEETLGRDLVRAFVDLNFGPQQDYPGIQIRQPDAEDLAALVDAVAKLVPLGLRVEQSVLRDKLGLPDPDAGAELLAAPAAALPQEAPAMNRARNAEEKTAEEDPLDAQLARLEDAAQAPMAAMIDVLRRKVLEATSLEELRDGLLDAWPEMDAGRLAEVMAEALAAAAMAGRYEILEGL